MLRNPLADPLFLPALEIVAGLLVFGLLLVLFFARHDLKAGLKGELGHRFLGWLIIAPLFLLGAFSGALVGGALLLLAMAQVVWEYVRVVDVARPYVVYLFAFIPVTVLTAGFVPGWYFALPAGSILLLTLIPILGGQVQDLYLQLSYAGRGYLYLVWTLGHLVLLMQLGGVGLVLVLGVGVALSDVMQYTLGKLLGRHIISPAVNPRKAWEGLLGDLLGAGLAVFLFRGMLPPQFTPLFLVILAVLIGLGAAWGDLASSLVKRAAGAKDWGHLVPGHGGLLDRANSLVIAIPVAYYYAYLLLAGRT